VFIVPAADLVVLPVDLLVLGDGLGPLLVGAVRPVDRHAVGFGVKQHPGALEQAFHAVQVAAGLGLDHYVAGLLAAGAGGVGGCAEMQRHAVFTEHAAVPGTTVEADVDLSGFLDHHFQAPRFELLLDPGLGLGQGRRSDDASADAVGQEVGVFHRPVVGPSGFDDFLDGFVLRESGKGATEGQQDRQCERGNSFHGRILLDNLTKIIKSGWMA
jgi:hypothetical protein